MMLVVLKGRGQGGQGEIKIKEKGKDKKIFIHETKIVKRKHRTTINYLQNQIIKDFSL